MMLSNGKSKTCDKCDSRKHLTDDCPHFKKARDGHKDAWVNLGAKKPRQMGGGAGNFVLHGARCVKQPGDGSCLYHSLCHGLGGMKTCLMKPTAKALRGELANFIARNPRVEISGDTIEEWVQWDANSSVSQYARSQAVGGWGGGIEMASCAYLKRVNVHVYERRWLGGYKRISCFEPPQSTSKTIHVLYQGGVHYDALVID